MRRWRRWIAFSLAWVSISATLSAQETALRRFALIAGANDGGYERVRLRYAASDAQTFSAVMETMGGVRSQDKILLVNPDFVEFQDGLRRIKEMIQAAKGGSGRTELIVYYSGHSDEQGILLGRERYSYTRLRREISNAEADVRVAILDSCSSGAITRTKGGERQPAFLLDISHDTEGYAFLTSSSEDEVAQESDRIGGSFFTYYLVSGLRGAADASGDSLVTLNEAYNYAFAETLSSTESTRYGPQHPAYDINLTGTGDLILTDLRQTTGLMIIEAPVGGRLFVRDHEGRLIAELTKVQGEELRLGLDAGAYTVRLQREGEVLDGTVIVGSGGPTRVRADMLVGSRPETTVGRGRVPGGERAVDQYEKTPVHFSVLPEFSIHDGLFASTEIHAVSLNLLMGNAAAVDGMQVSVIASMVADEMRGFQGAGVGNAVGQNVSGYQAAGLINYVGRDVEGGQGAGVLNFTRGSVLGFEGAGVLNMALGGIQGAQVAGVGNISGEETSGVQLAGIFNYSSADVEGAQIAGGANRSQTIVGTQISILNMSRQVTGAQVGIVNTTREITGTQIGLVNISERMNGIPIGLINYEKEGSHHAEVWWQGDETYNFGLRLGAGHLYTLIRGGFVRKTDPMDWSVGAGMGIHIPMEPFFINVDGSVTQQFAGSDTAAAWDMATLKPAVRVAAGWSAGGGFGLLVGGNLDLEVPGWHVSGDAPLKISPRPYIGIQFGNPGHRGAVRPSGPWDEVDWDKKMEEKHGGAR